MTNLAKLLTKWVGLAQHLDLPPRIRTRQVHYYVGSKNTFEVVDLEPRSSLLNRVSATAGNEQILIHD
jgi:hypothetical protein